MVKTKTFAVRCEGKIAEGRRCARKTTAANGYCGVCKGPKAKPVAKTGGPTAVAASEQKKKRDPRRISAKRPKPYERATRQVVASYKNIIAAYEGDKEKMWERFAPFLASRNCTTGRPYSGLNQLILAFVAVDRGYKTPNWATYKQLRENGGQVRKGSKGITLLRPVPIMVEDPNDPGKKIPTGDVYYRTFTAFNIDDVDFPKGRTAPHAYTPQPPEGAAAKITEKAAQAGIKIVHQPSQDLYGGVNARAFYRPSADTINMPPREQFKTDEEYAAVLLHEIGHWTGHESRCNRVKGKRHGDEDYAREELTAEIVAWVAAHKWGIPQTSKNQHNHASYLASWEPAAGDDPEKLLKAASRAGKALRYLEKIGLMPDEQAPAEQLLAA